MRSGLHRAGQLPAVQPDGRRQRMLPPQRSASECFASGEFRACLQTCSDHADCGWSMECLAQIGGLCYLSFCGASMQSTDLQAPCTLDGNRRACATPVARHDDAASVLKPARLSMPLPARWKRDEPTQCRPGHQCKTASASARRALPKASASRSATLWLPMKIRLTPARRVPRASTSPLLT